MFERSVVGSGRVEPSLITRRRLGPTVGSVIIVGLLFGACGEDEQAPPPDVLPKEGAPLGYGRGGQAYDVRRQRLVYFDGYHPSGSVGGEITAYNATWKWNGSVWAQVADAGPSPRYDVAMAYDAVRGVVVLHGGFGACGTEGFSCCNDTWEWNGVAWRPIDGPGPGPRHSANLSFDPQTRTLLLFGGDPCGEGSPNRSLWRFDGQNWSEVGP